MNKATDDESEFRRKVDDLAGWKEGSDPVELQAISDAQALIAGAKLRLVDAVRAARSEGSTWRDIGRALGTTHQSAHKKFAPLVDGNAS